MEQASRGLRQHVVVGASLDSFAQRRLEIAFRLGVFEIDQAGPEEWKRQRLIELGFGIPDWLCFVPVDFEAGGPWREGLVTAGLDDTPAPLTIWGMSIESTPRVRCEWIAPPLRQRGLFRMRNKIRD